MRRLVLLVALLGSTACLRKTEYQCQTSSQCGAGNTCESTGYCSFPDSECQRYVESAGPLAGQCVGGMLTDGGMTIDAPPNIDGGDIDAPPPAGCPNGYEPLGGIANGHRYKLVTAMENWMTQHTSCTITSASAYLAIPDDQAELTALSALAGQDYWVGIQDPTEGTYVNVKGQPQTFLPWANGQPDNNGPGEEDCVVADSAMSQILDEKCQTKFRAVCECEP